MTLGSERDLVPVITRLSRQSKSIDEAIELFQSVLSGHIRGLTETLPLHVEAVYNDYDFVGDFAAASLLAGLAIVTLIAKSLLERALAADLHRASEA